MHGLRNLAMCLRCPTSVEVSEPMGLFILNKVNRIVHVECHGLYRDDGLIIVYGNQRENDNIRKILFKPFQGLDFEIQLGYMAEQSHLYCP